MAFLPKTPEEKAKVARFSAWCFFAAGLSILGTSLVDRFVFHEKAQVGGGTVFFILAVVMFRVAERHRVASLKIQGPTSS